MNTKRDNLLLVLGWLSFLLYPITAVPGIVIAHRHRTSLSARGQLGYRLCWIACALFAVHLVIIGVMIHAGGR